MSVTINSGVPATASYETSLTTPPLILNTPSGTSSTGGSVSISSVIGLQAALDGKLNDVASPVGLSSVFTNGVDINLLAGLNAYGLTQLDLQKLADVDASDIEINHLIGVTGSIQAQIDAAYSDVDFTAADQVIVSTGVGAATVATLSDVLDGTVGIGYEFTDLRLATTDLDFNAQTGVNAADPVNPQDVATKNYVDVQITSGSAFLPLVGGTMTGAIDMDGQTLVLDADGTTSFSAAVDDTAVLDVNGTLFTWTPTGFDMAAQLITNLADPVNPQDAVTLASMTAAVTAGVNTSLLIDGSNAMTATLDAGTNLISNVVDPVNPQDAVTLASMTAALATVSANSLQIDGSNSMTADLDLGGFNIDNVAAPTAGDQVGDRNFNDGRYLLSANNLSDLADITTAKTNLALSTVATSGDYNDLINAPSLAAALNDLTDVTTGTLGAAEDRHVLTWDNGTSGFIIEEAQVVSVFGRTGAITATAGDYTASQITFTPVGDISATDVQAALTEVAAEKLAIDGSIPMGGNLDLGGNQIVNAVEPFVVGPHSMTSGVLQGSGGYLLRTGTGTEISPTYAFDGNTTTGMWFDGGLGFTVGGVNQIELNGTNVSVENNQIKNVATPTDNGDAVNLAYIDGLGAQRLLGSATGIDLLTSPASTAVPIYTLPVGKMHIITNVIVVATSYTPGTSPVDPVVSVGIAGPNYDQIVSTTVASWGPSGSGDQAVYLEPQQGAATPNAVNTVAFQVDAPANGTFSALTVSVYVMGIEL